MSEESIRAMLVSKIDSGLPFDEDDKIVFRKIRAKSQVTMKVVKEYQTYKARLEANVLYNEDPQGDARTDLDGQSTFDKLDKMRQEFRVSKMFVSDAAWKVERERIAERDSYGLNT